MPGKLTLIPTPIDDETPLEAMAQKLLLDKAMDANTIILVEEHKTCRRRWLNWQLPREAIEKFRLYNEHNQAADAQSLVDQIKSGKEAYLISDCGLPAFCDPGQGLVDLCHKNKIQVTSTPFPNSIALAVALCGFNHRRFFFMGFPATKGDERREDLKRAVESKEVVVLMDTPYRLEKLLEELKSLGHKKQAFLGIDLNMSSERLMRGNLEHLSKNLGKEKKKPFILVLDA